MSSSRVLIFDFEQVNVCWEKAYYQQNIVAIKIPSRLRSDQKYIKRHAELVGTIDFVLKSFWLTMKILIKTLSLLIYCPY